jgi:hypothetical protein
MVVGLAALGVVSSLVSILVAALIFFTGYVLAYEPYRALYPDTVGRDAAGRAQGAQALWRGTGTGIALLGGGLLLAVGRGRAVRGRRGRLARRDGGLRVPAAAARRPGSRQAGAAPCG